MKDTIPTLNSIWVSNRLYNLNVSTINYSGSVIPWNLRHDPLIFQWHLIWRIQNFQFKFQLLESSERGLKKFVPRNMYRGNGAIEVKTGKRRTFEIKLLCSNLSSTDSTHRGAQTEYYRQKLRNIHCGNQNNAAHFESFYLYACCCIRHLTNLIMYFLNNWIKPYKILLICYSSFGYARQYPITARISRTLGSIFDLVAGFKCP